ncbi:MAG: peptide ABC transporter substrate-binding protein, partial [Lactococcus sp.]|nr:peptide ABC transporter substrate-binding protein [Lactococcus sp.]
MKNKKMMLVILVIVIIGLGSVVIPKLMKQQDTVKTDAVKIGVLQYVTHPALDEIYAGIKQGLSDEGYSKAKLNFYNAQ